VGIVHLCHPHRLGDLVPWPQYTHCVERNAISPGTGSLPTKIGRSITIETIETSCKTSVLLGNVKSFIVWDITLTASVV
jgi:hypothetical protein